MYRSDQQHMLEDQLEHPNDLFVSAKSKRAALVSTKDGNSVFMTGDFSGSMKELEKDVRQAKKNWPFDKRG